MYSTRSQFESCPKFSIHLYRIISRLLLMGDRGGCGGGGGGEGRGGLNFDSIDSSVLHILSNDAG
jgi:hypothetical protein